tara:strand:- start:46 stop:267 length:222 start_codon:yes stop_codon:yes gene_type:complete
MIGEHTPVGEERGNARNQQYDRAVLAACVKVIVLKQPGWDRSTGVAAEIKIATEMGLPVEFMEPTEQDTPKAK